MIEVSVAQSAPETTEAQPAYVLRGRGLFDLYHDDLQYLGSGKWLVPSGSECSKVYEVRVGIRRESTCECIGYVNHKHCSHVVCGTLAHKRSATCDSCGQRRWWKDITEVHEEDGLLGWHPGDRLCRTCIRGGAWS